MPVKDNDSIMVTDEIRDILEKVAEQRRLEDNAVNAAKESFDAFVRGAGTSEVVVGDISDAQDARDRIQELAMKLLGEIRKQYTVATHVGKLRRKYSVKRYDCDCELQA